MVLKDESLCHLWKFTRIEFFFEHLSGRNSKTVSLFAWFLGIFVLSNVIVCGLGMKNLEFAIW